MTAERQRETVAVRRVAEVSAVVATLGAAAACWMIALHRMTGMDMSVATPQPLSPARRSY
jgi:hypothetical protein